MSERPDCLAYVALIAALVTLALSGCGGGLPAAEPDVQPEEVHEDLPNDVVGLTPESIQNAGIRIEKAETIRLQEQLETTGVVSPNESRVAHIRPLARGVIEKVYVRRGARVSQGRPLILYDNIELGELIGEYLSEQAQLQKHLAELEVTRKFWERGVELFEVQAIAEKEVELREAQLKNAQAMVESQRSEIAKIEEKLHRFGLTESDIKELNQTEHREGGRHRTASHNILRAPFSGVIIGYDVAEGELVEPSRELLTLADVSTVWVLADVYEKDLGLIREGQQVTIFSPSYPERTFRGRLTYISDVLEKETRTARVRCVVSNPENLLKLEMFVTVRIPTIRQRTTVAVPTEAIQNLDGQDVVFVAEAPGRFRKVAVNTGLTAGGWTEVDGVAEGTPVVSKGSFYLKSTVKRSEIEPEH
ncbi:MAG: efflux RND transporter periplasmic adaptor subunit [Acidobacteriota bacterium]